MPQDQSLWWELTHDPHANSLAYYQVDYQSLMIVKKIWVPLKQTTFPKYITRVAFVYFGIREQKQILIIGNCFIIFSKYSPIKIETFLHAFEPIVQALWLRYLQNMHSERINRFFRFRKTLTSHFIFYVRE